jgi:hypothetical protein
MNDYPRIINFKSLPKNNFFAPEWNYYIYEDMLANIDLKKISNLILKKESEILKNTKDANNDGFTGLEKNSLTSKFTKYNLLEWQNEEIFKIKKAIVETHNNFTKLFNLYKPDQKIWAQCWANVLRKGEKIDTHSHSTHQDTYLGGLICIQVSNTNTNYTNIYSQLKDPEIYCSKNINGKITLFQNFIPHYSTPHEENTERITIAFDLMIEEPKIENRIFIRIN